MANKRTELQREIVEALVSSKAVNLEAVGSVLAKFGARAAVAGDAFGVLVHWRVYDICIPPFLVDPIAMGEAETSAAAAVER